MFDRNHLDPYIIAEIGVNHEGSLDRAFEQIDAAARGGAHAAKFQTYKADLLASKGASPAYWDTSKEPTQSQHELFNRYDSFTESDYERLAVRCSEVGVDFMSTPFDLAAVEMLAPMVPAFKVASADITNIPLIRAVAATGKPLIMSTGAATLREIRTAVDVVRKAGATELVLLHCVLRYPTPPAVANLATISMLRREFGEVALIGYSDHVAPSVDGSLPALQQAAHLGAVVLEKHFTDDRRASGNDHYHATDEEGLRAYVDWLNHQRLLSGSGSIEVESQHLAVANARRRIFLSADVSRGSVLLPSSLVALRANRGIEIAAWDSVVGRVASRDLSQGAPLFEDDMIPVEVR